MSETMSGDVVVAEDVVRCRNLAAENLAQVQWALQAAKDELAQWELQCWKRLPPGYGIKTDGTWELVKVSR